LPDTIEKAQALAGYSRPGSPYDNAQAEAGWSTLKTELLPYGGAFASLEEARLEVAYCLNTYFNFVRRHSALGYRSPHRFERDFQLSLSWCTIRFYWTTPKYTSFLCLA
jgi:putative transposase